MGTSKNPNGFKVVTHGGQAHADEVLAIALVMIKEGIGSPYQLDISRVTDGRARDWPDADFVIDVGKDCDPRKRWFDHHQFPREASPACAFTLVARHYGVDMSRLPWVEKLAVIDSKGPYAWFEKVMGRRPKDGQELVRVNGSDSIFNYLAATANRDFRIGVGLAKEWLNEQLTAAAAREAAVALAMSKHKVVILGDTGVKMAFFDTDDSQGTLAATDKLAFDDPSIIVAGMLDDRSDGYSAIRMNDDPRVDFLPRAKDKGCVFAHVTGFCLKWEKDWDSFVEALCKSVNPGQP